MPLYMIYMDNKWFEAYFLNVKVCQLFIKYTVLVHVHVAVYYFRKHKEID